MIGKSLLLYAFAKSELLSHIQPGVDALLHERCLAEDAYELPGCGLHVAVFHGNDRTLHVAAGMVYRHSLEVRLIFGGR